jgi:flagellar hook-associated protein 1 FlgK
MSLSGALNAATTALSVDQTAIQVTGNNIANAADPNYSREVTDTSPGIETQLQPGIFVGSGVDLTGISRAVDDALNQRLNASNSDVSAATTTQAWTSQVQTTLNALSGSDLSSSLGTFFTGWSNLAADPTNSGLRQVVVQDGQNTATYLNNLSTSLGQLTTTLNNELPQQVQSVNTLTTDIASLNVQVNEAQGGAAGTANALLDQRDTDLSKLSALVNITTSDQPDGTVNVYVGSQPLVQGQNSRTLTVAGVADSTGASIPTVVFSDTGGTVPATSGSIGAVDGARAQIASASAQIDTIAHNLISEVNQVHAGGQGTSQVASVTATNAVDDTTAALNSSAAGLQFNVSNGSFVLHLQQSSGLSTSTLIPVNETGSPNDTSLTTLAASLNAVAGVKATIVGGTLTIAATDPGATLSFSQDSSGALASLGINTFFTGSNAGDISVNSTVANNPGLLAAAANGEAGDNSNALAISKLETAPAAGLGGISLDDAYNNLVNQVGNSVATATANVTSASAVQTTLTGQQQSLGGVSVDEETVNLIQQQNAYQAAARVVQTVYNMVQSLLGITI